MKKQIIKYGIRYLIFAVCIWAFSGINTSYAQRIKWLRVTQQQSPINEIGVMYENELGGPVMGDYHSWPVQYGIDQTTYRMKGFWIGCKNFDDPVEGKVKSLKVVGAGPRDGSSWTTQVFPLELKLIGKNFHPGVYVDDQLASLLNTYDILDSQDPNLECDRMVLVKFNTSIGVSVTQKTMVFDNSENDNYYIKDWVFKNTGIYNAAGDVKQQTLDSVYFYFTDRVAYSGVSCSGYGQGWGAWETTWGNSDLIHSIGADPTAPDFEMRALYQWYGPCKTNPLQYKEDWGNPARLEDGQLASAKYTGVVILHADKSPQDPSDDPWQPTTNNFIGSDLTIYNATSSQYDEVFMADRWAAITDGHPAPGKQLDDICDDDYPINFQDPRRNTFGGPHSEYACGPYKLAPGDSIHIAAGEGTAGLGMEKNREVGGNWLKWWKNEGTPILVMPDGSTTTDHNLYKRRWCETGKDSIMQTMRNAIKNYKAGYKIPMPPPPPKNFVITSGGDRIQLSWADNADAAPHFDGYVIYRSRGNVLDRRSVYEKIFECSKSNVVHNFDDITAIRGFDYYYYIQSKDDGTQNDVHPGLPLYSSLFWTVTSVPATLQRPAVTGPPTAPAVDTTHWKQLVSKGTWVSGADYVPNDEVTFGALSYVCVRRDSGGKQTPDIDTTKSWKPEVSKGAWVSGSGYAKYNVVSYNGVNYYCYSDIAQGSLLEQVRVVPNPYDIRARMFQFGDQSQYDRLAFYGLPPVCNLKIFTERGDLIWQKSHTNGTGDELWDSMTSSGQIIASGIYILYVEAPGAGSVFRKFVVIR
ncbi:MAG: hypothetical protein ABSB78_14685 [Bacteroidota bacterium]